MVLFDILCLFMETKILHFDPFSHLLSLKKYHILSSFVDGNMIFLWHFVPFNVNKILHVDPFSHHLNLKKISYFVNFCWWKYDFLVTFCAFLCKQNITFWSFYPPFKSKKYHILLTFVDGNMIFCDIYCLLYKQHITFRSL